MKKNIVAVFTCMCLAFGTLLGLTGCELNQTSNDSTSEVSQENLPPDQRNFTLTFIGHASVKLKTKDGKVIYIDPQYPTGDFSEPADFVLVTHDHEDHVPNKNVARKDNCVDITWNEALVTDHTYHTFEYDNLKIEAVPAGGNPYHHMESCVGYLVSFDGVTVYHSGDTSMIDEMNNLKDKKIDYAMYPVDGVYNMKAKEATEVANLVGAEHNIPIHSYNVGNKLKEDNFLPDKGRLYLQDGQTISLKDGSIIAPLEN